MKREPPDMLDKHLPTFSGALALSLVAAMLLSGCARSDEEELAICQERVEKFNACPGADAVPLSSCDSFLADDRELGCDHQATDVSECLNELAPSDYCASKGCDAEQNNYLGCLSLACPLNKTLGPCVEFGFK